MNPGLLVGFVRGLGGLLALVTLAVIFAGIWRGAQQPVGTTVGRAPQVLRSGWFYLAASLVYFGVCFGLWIPIRLALPPVIRTVLLVAGALIYFPGMGLTLWARLVLGKMYFVSTGLGAQLFADHRLVTQGPFGIVRHPMYLGISLAVVGGLLLYQTWTMALMLILPLGLALRARREEQALSREFGEAYQAYLLRTGMFFPRLK